MAGRHEPARADCRPHGRLSARSACSGTTASGSLFGGGTNAFRPRPFHAFSPIAKKPEFRAPRRAQNGCRRPSACAGQANVHRAVSKASQLTSPQLRLSVQEMSLLERFPPPAIVFKWRINDEVHHHRCTAGCCRHRCLCPSLRSGSRCVFDRSPEDRQEVQSRQGEAPAGECGQSGRQRGKEGRKLSHPDSSAHS
jgi:hypothetical protein